MNESATLPRTSLAVLALVATLLVAVPQPAAALSTYLNVDQLDVNNAVDAGVAVAQRAFVPEDTDAVVLATDGNFPDGLSASALAGSVEGPILFTQLLELPQQTREEIDRLLDPGDTVYLMGGSAAISPAVEDQLAEEYTTVRLAGSTRLETAAESAELVGVDADNPRVVIARAFGPDGANTPSDRTTGWVDAISCGAFAAASGIPILLTETDVLSGTTEDALRDLDPDEAIVCGGTAAVAASVVGDINDLGIEVERVEGITRVETAIDAARTLFGASTAEGGTFSVVPGYGESFGYGLAAAPLGHPILLVGQFEPTLCSDGSQPSRETLCYLRTAGEETAQLVVVGDEDVIADPVVDALGEAAGGRDIADIPTLAAPQNVTATDNINDGGTQATVSWNAVADPDEILAGYQVFIDGEPAPGQTPTAGPQATTTVVGGLEPDVEASITVAAIDLGDREGAMSEPATVTPEDEVPGAITNFEASPRDAAVALTWDVGPIDTASYTISRADEDDLLGVPIGCVTFEELAVIEQPSATSFTDDTAENGSSYCYQITVTDQADQTSEPSETDPVTPEPGVPQASIQFPVETTTEGSLLEGPTTTRDTVYAGEALVIEYTLEDSDTPLTDLRVTWEVSLDAGATYTEIQNGANVAPTYTDVESGAATFQVPPCAEAAAGEDDEAVLDPAGCGVPDRPDPANPELRYRVTVVDPQDRASRANSGNLEESQTPGPVQGLTALPGDGLATVLWDRKDLLWESESEEVTYLVDRASYTSDPDDEPDVEDCDNLTYGNERVVEQPADNQDTVSTIISGLLNGTDDVDTYYCFRVRANRPDVGVGPAVVTVADPEEDLGGVIGLRQPENGSAVDRGQREIIEFEIQTAQGVTPEEVLLEFCADYDRATGTCEDGGPGNEGFQLIDVVENPRVGSNTYSWAVPEDATTQQADGETGAVRATLSTAGGDADSALATGILFRTI